MDFYLGIDCGGTHLRLGLVTSEGQLLAHSRLKSPLVNNPNNFGKVVFAEYSNLLTSETLNLKPKLIAIGVGVPGPIDRQSGSILHSANLHNDSPIHFVKQLKSSFSSSVTSFSSKQTSHEPLATSNEIPIFFDRDAEVALWGEFWQGAARDCQNCLLLTLGTGIGGAIMADGKIISGVSDNAGEIGHMYLSVGSFLASSNSSKQTSNEQRPARIATRSVAGGATSNEIPTCGLGHEGCFEAWLKQSPPEDRPYILGLGLASLVDIFNPAKIILGGGMIEYNEIDLEEVITIMKDKAVQPLGAQTEVVKASLGDRAGVVGAAYLCIKDTKKSRQFP